MKILKLHSHSFCDMIWQQFLMSCQLQNQSKVFCIKFVLLLNYNKNVFILLLLFTVKHQQVMDIHWWSSQTVACISFPPMFSPWIWKVNVNHKQIWIIIQSLHGFKGNCKALYIDHSWFHLIIHLNMVGGNSDARQYLLAECWARNLIQFIKIYHGQEPRPSTHVAYTSTRQYT